MADGEARSGAGHLQAGRTYAGVEGPLERVCLGFGVIYSGSSATSNALSLWQPQILKSFGLTNLQTGLLNMIPFGIACVFMVFWRWRRTNPESAS